MHKATKQAPATTPTQATGELHRTRLHPEPQATPVGYRGNQAALRRLSSTAPRLQCKLEIGGVSDALETEADRVAEQVLRMPDPDLSTGAAPPQLSRKCDACEDEDTKTKLQPKHSPAQAVPGTIVEGSGEEDDTKTPASPTGPAKEPPSEQASLVRVDQKPASTVPYWGETDSSRQRHNFIPNVGLTGGLPQPLPWAALQGLAGGGGPRISGPPVPKTLADISAGGGQGAAGYTDWPAGYKAPDFDFNTTATGADWSSRPTVKTAAFEGASGSFYTAAGKYKTGGKEGGKDVYWNFSPAISDLVKTGEQEHCDDYAEAYRISLKEADAIVAANIAGKTFGPKAAKADAENLVLAEITAKLTHPALGNDKSQWAAKYSTLFNKTLTRDTSGWHSISLGARTVDGSGNVIYEVVKGTSKIGTVKPSAIITY